MKHSVVILALAALLPAAALFAAAPQAGLKITKLTGTVNVMKDGLVVMTLKPGDAIPSLVDAAMSFAVVDGSVEVEAGGQKFTATTGSNFTIDATNGGDVKVSVAAGAPVEMKTRAGNTLVMASDSATTIKNDGERSMEIAVKKGNATMMDASGGAPRTIVSGQQAIVHDTSVSNSTLVRGENGLLVSVKTEESVSELVMILPMPPLAPVIPTQEVQESCEVSGSTPGCN